MRKSPTATERLLWTALRNKRLRGLKFRRQHVIAGYVVDFYCAALRLAVEVDGPIHRPDEDRLRDTHLAKLGVAVLRFAASSVESDLAGVVISIAEACEKRMPR